MKRLLAMGAAACAPGPVADALDGQKTVGVRLEAGYQYFFVDGDPMIEPPLGDIPVETRIEYGLAAFAVSCFSRMGRRSRERQAGRRAPGCAGAPR